MLKPSDSINSTATGSRSLVAHASKFRMPSTRAAFVRRKVLAEQIERAGASKLLLVRAPAGFGKTTALRQICEQFGAMGVATSWITLDSGDNDPPRFLNCMAEAIARLGLFDEATTASNSEALALLEREGPPFALFLDEFEVVQSPAVARLVREVVERLPRNGRLVIGSRALPDVGLARLRVRLQLLEIGVDQLRFTLEETREFIGLQGVTALPETTLEQLHAKTEGWIAALALAVAALEQQSSAASFVERLSGSSIGITDYLAEDVLNQQPADVRDFLLRTSILRELNLSICRSLVPGIDCSRMLDHLGEAGLFLMPAENDEAQPSYRYHRLFADFLRSRLFRESPEELLQLHLAASAWYESVGRPKPAIDHAIESGVDSRVWSLLAENAQLFLEQGRVRLLARWFAAVAAKPHDHSALDAIHVWVVLFTHGPEDAMALLASNGIECCTDAVVAGHVNALRPLLLTMVDRYDQAKEVGDAALARLPTCVPFADTVLANCMALVTSVFGDKPQAQRLLDAARRTQSSSRFERMHTECTEGLLDLERGRFRQAAARFRLAVDATTRERDFSHAGGTALAGMLYAGALYEAGDLANVERLLNVYLPLATDVGLLEHIISGHAMQARLLFDRGDVDDALRVLTELETLGHIRKLPRVVAAARLERARWMIRQGQPQGAREELDRADDRTVWTRVARQRLQAHEVSDIGIARMSWEIHFGDAAAVAARIARELPAVDAEMRVRRSRKLRLLKAMALCQAGSPEASFDEMRGLLEEVAREGMVRLVVDEGPLAGPPIQAALARFRSSPRSDPVVIECGQRLLDVLGTKAMLAEVPSAIATAPTWPMESLTQKESEVLELLAEGYSNSAISEKLLISDSTARTHLRAISMKLGASSRTQAVSLGRRYGLIR